MAAKKFPLNEDLEVTIAKRRLSRSIRLSIAANGEVRVSIPTWITYRAGLAFAKGKLDWIVRQRQAPVLLQPGQMVGKQHQIFFKVSIKATKVSTRLKDGQIIITHPLSVPVSAPEVQVVATKAAIRALRAEAEQVLPGRLRQLAAEHGYAFKSVDIKQLTGRWGSCDQQQRIALNLFLMQLPWELIDYVLVHELVHTKHLNHGPEFWATFESVLPNARQQRSIIKKHKPVVMAVSRV